MNFAKSTLILAGVALLGAIAFVYSGLFPPGADEPHSDLVYRVIETARDRAIAVRADDIAVPPLEDPALIRSGAGNYAAMCTGCHLAPGMAPTELSQGLYPSPPALARVGAPDPARAFWVIKHGIKASGMPAWGRSMEDRYLWGMVAFLQRLPSLSADEYAALVASSEGHSHGGGESMPHAHAGDDAGHDTESNADAPANGAVGATQDDSHPAPHPPGPAAAQDSTAHVHADGSVHHHDAPSPAPASEATPDEPAEVAEPTTHGDDHADHHDH